MSAAIEKKRKVARSDADHLNDIMLHKAHVFENAEKLAQWHIVNGRPEVARMLIVNAYTHDLDKFGGIQWQYMRKGAHKTKAMELAVEEHNTTNKHHPNAWGKIQNMDDLYLMELVCDCIARSQEIGTSIRSWFDNEATKRYGFKIGDEIHTKIMAWVDIILDAPLDQRKK